MRGTLGSAALLIVVALVVLRPWEGGGERGLPEASAVRVIRAVDGDTLEVAMPGGEREDVRLIGVDTPETVKPGTPVQCFGPRASAFTHRVADGRRARLELGVERRDAYGRLLAYARVERRRRPARPLFLNAALLRRGLARTLTIPPNDRLAPRFHGLELAAARAGRGLWRACRP